MKLIPVVSINGVRCPAAPVPPEALACAYANDVLYVAETVEEACALAAPAAPTAPVPDQAGGSS